MSHFNLDELQAAADAMYHRLDQQRPLLSGTSSSRPASQFSSQSRRRNPVYQHAKTAEEADQMHRDSILARQLNEQYNSSLHVNPSTARRQEMQDSSLGRPPRYSLPPRYSQIVHDRRDGGDVRDDEMLARQIQEQYNSSLAVDAPSRSHSRHRREARVERQIQDQYNSSLAPDHPITHPQHDPDSPRTHFLSKQRQTRNEEEALNRQIQGQYNSSLAVNHTSTRSTAATPTLDQPPRYTQIPHHHAFFNPSSQQSWGADSKAEDQLAPGRWPDRPLVESNPERARSRKQEKKPQIRAKDHEQKLRWLACQRSLRKR